MKTGRPGRGTGGSREDRDFDTLSVTSVCSCSKSCLLFPGSSQSSVDFLGLAFVAEAEDFLHAFDDRTTFPFMAVNDRFAVRAAQRTEFVDVALHQFQGPDAGVAEIFFAFRTVKRRGGVAVIEAGKGARRRRGSRSGGSLGQVRYGNGGFGGVEEEFDFAQAQGLAGLESGFLDLQAIDEAAVGGVEVADGDDVVHPNDLAVGGGDGGVIDADIVLDRTT